MKTKFRSFLSVLLAAIILLSVVPFSVSAAEEFVVKSGVLTQYNGTSKDIVIPSNVYYIADSVFMDNTSIKSVNLNGVSIIGNNAFSGCTSLETVTGYSNVTSCGAYAFFQTPFQNNRSSASLVMGSVLVQSNASGSYTIPSGVESISPYAFVSNTGITSVTIGDGVSSIGEGAFYGCKNLSNISVSSQVSYIGAFAFEGTKYLSSVTDQFLILGNSILVQSNTTATAINIPAGVKSIAPGAFYGNKKITSVIFPSSLVSIGMRAFGGCTSLKKADLPQNLKALDKEAFYNCTALTEVVIPDSVDVIGDSVYLGCTSLTTVKNMSNASISSGMFAGCKALKYVMNSSLTSFVESYAFYNCSSLLEVSLPGTVTSIHPTAFEGCNKLSVHCYLNSFAGEYLSDLGITVYEIGDVNNDKKLNIRDATHIQKAAADIVTLSFSDTLRADADFNAVINIRDATRVQKEVAGLI